MIKANYIILLPSSSDDHFLAHQLGTSKTNPLLVTNNHSDFNLKIVESKKNSKFSTINLNKNSNSPISLNLQHIIDNRRTLSLGNINF